MEIKKLDINGSFLISNHKFEDDRGAFERLFDDRKLKDIKFNGVRNINLSRNISKGTVRGLHMQTGAGEELKIIKCLKGRILDLFVDCRPDSDTFRKITKVELSGEEPDSILVPRSCLHSFLTLEENTEVIYFTDNYYFPDLEICVSPFSALIEDMWHPNKIISYSDKDSKSMDLKELFNKGKEIIK